jgi:metal-responsive CopG/Arc/MetJ family transcriptional regulator
VKLNKQSNLPLGLDYCKRMKITLEISEEELALIDEFAVSAGISRDKCVENILQESVEKHKKENSLNENLESVG